MTILFCLKIWLIANAALFIWLTGLGRLGQYDHSQGGQDNGAETNRS